MALYSNGTISFEKAIFRLKPENLTDQWAFKTQNSINCLKYGGVLYEEDPQYFYEMYENLEHKGIMVDNNQLYLMQNPQLYKLPTD